jgi:hypothetical protein
LRGHWLSTILQDCGAASNPVLFCGLFASAQNVVLPISKCATFKSHPSSPNAFFPHLKD